MNPVNDGLCRALLINLDRDAQRLAWMSQQLAAANIQFERVPAVLGTQTPESVASFFPGENQALLNPLRVGEIGCYASHLVAMQRIATGALGPVVLVLEDDLRVSADLLDVIRDSTAKLPEGWDMLRLSNPPKRSVKVVASLADGRDLIQYSKIPNSTGAYLITVEGAQKLLRPVPRFRPVDEDMRRPWRYGLREFGIVPAPVQPDILDQSSIELLQPKSTLQRRGLTARLIGKVEFTHLLDRPLFNIRTLGVAAWLTCLGQNIWDKIARPTGLPGRIRHRESFQIVERRQT